MDTLTHALCGASIGLAYAPTEEVRTSMMIIGALAGVMPDLDCLLELKGKQAAWRYHRVLLHGLPTLLPQLLVVYGMANLSRFNSPSFDLPNLTLVLMIGMALLSHLVLDSVTSFGTGLGFPFSHRRYSTHSHFIVDPLMLCILIGGLIASSPKFALLAGAFYLGVTIAWRHCLLRFARDSAHNAGALTHRTSIEPGLCSPWRWLALTEMPSGAYAIAPISWPAGAVLKWRTVVSLKASDPAVQRARVDPLVTAFLATTDYPRWSWQDDDASQRELLVEDLKWWSALPFRPLSFRITFDARGAVSSVAQQSMFWRGQRRPHN